jgi:hypothetical protein
LAVKVCAPRFVEFYKKEDRGIMPTYKVGKVTGLYSSIFYPGMWLDGVFHAFQAGNSASMMTVAADARRTGAVAVIGFTSAGIFEIYSL